MWNEEFTDVQREFVRTATEEALDFAREQGIPTPDPVFRPEERNITSRRSEQRLIAEKTKEVWQQAKPFVTDTFYLKRAENTVVHENAFWEQHAYMGMRENMYAQSGQHSSGQVSTSRSNLQLEDIRSSNERDHPFRHKIFSHRGPS